MAMSFVDDPTLALIVRFVTDDIDALSDADEEFLKQQLEEIHQLVANEAADQRQQIILDWIKEYAEQYRNQWHTTALTRLLSESRCKDCPLIRQGDDRQCVIHHRWTLLLEKYLTGGISTDTYVEETLYLLKEQKELLKISRISSRLQGI